MTSSTNRTTESLRENDTTLFIRKRAFVIFEVLFIVVIFLGELQYGTPHLTSKTKGIINNQSKTNGREKSINLVVGLHTSDGDNAHSPICSREEASRLQATRQFNRLHNHRHDRHYLRDEDVDRHSAKVQHEVEDED